MELYLYSPYTPTWRGQGDFTFNALGRRFGINAGESEFRN